MKKHGTLLALASMAGLAQHMGAPDMGFPTQQPFGRMPQKDFEAAVRAKAKHQIEVANRKRKEREENPREKKRVNNHLYSQTTISECLKR